MLRDERGSILIEFVGSFLLYMFLIGSILNLVTVVTVQARMHYALTQTANMLSMYGYVLHATGMDEPIMNLNRNAGEFLDTANSGIDNINRMLGGFNSVDAGEISGGADDTKEWFNSNKSEIFKSLINYGINEALDFAFAQLVTPLIEYYLSNGEQTGEEYLLSVRIYTAEGNNINKSRIKYYDFREAIPGYNPAGESEFLGSISRIPANKNYLLDKDGRIRITVRYEIEYSFFGLNRLLPWRGDPPTLEITQSAITQMWLGGAGEGYKDDDNN